MKRPSRALVAPGALGGTDLAEVLDLAAEPINQFEKALGGRAELIASLSIDATPEIRDLVEMLVDPHFDHRSLGWLATTVNIGLTDLLRAFRNGVLAKAQILACQQVAVKLPDVVIDVMKRAAPYEEPCEGCDGTGQMTVRPTKKVPIPDPPTVSCTICRGKGKIVRLPDLDRQRLALELGELIKTPRGGPTLLQQFNTITPASAGDTGTGALERMQQAVTDVLYGRHAAVVVDAEPIVEEETPCP